MPKCPGVESGVPLEDTIRRLEHGSFSPSLSTLMKLTLSTLFEAFELNERNITRELATASPDSITRQRSWHRMVADLLGQVVADVLPYADLAVATGWWAFLGPPAWT